MLTCTRFLAVASFVAVLVACSGEGSTDSKTDELPTEVVDKAELETYECNMDVVGEKVYVKDLKLNYECDGEKWFESYDQTKPGPSSSVIAGEAKQSSSSEKIRENGSSSSIGDSPKIYAEAKVMPSGTYDCSKYNCFTTEYLNQEFLEAGKYGEILDERDGQVYKTIEICDEENENCQIWMAENLNYASTGVIHNHVGDIYDSTSWCYDDDLANCAKYGRLYTWSAAMDSVATGCGYGSKCSLVYPVGGICPEGWHLPSLEEFSALIHAVGASSAGKVLKSQSGWQDDGNGTDAFGFSALPAGRRNYDEFWGEGYQAKFWSSTEIERGYNGIVDGVYANIMYLVYENEHANLPGEVRRFNEFSVRCIKN